MLTILCEFFLQEYNVLFFNVFSCQVCIILVFTSYSHLFGYTTNCKCLVEMMKTP